MRFIYTLEEKKFKEEKEKENEILRAFGIDEETIEKIYEYDKKMFNKNRSFCTKEVYLEDTFYKMSRPNVSLLVCDVHPFETTDDIEYGLQLIFPYHAVSQIDQLTLQALLLRINGYTLKEIGAQMHLKEYQVDYIFRKLKNYLKKFTKHS